MKMIAAVNTVGQAGNGRRELAGTLIIYRDNSAYTVTIKGHPNCTLF